MATDKLTPDELREIGIEVDVPEPTTPATREPVHACMTCRFRIKSYIGGDYDLCGARSNRRLVDYRHRSLNPDADCPVWEAEPPPVPSTELARSGEQALAEKHQRHPIVDVAKWVSLAFIIWVIFG